MRTRINKTMVMVLAFIGFVSAVVMTSRAEALEPRLLWEKEFKYKVESVDLAKESGDVIVGLENGREIILYDKSGNEKFHWGPRIDRAAGGVQISKDGKYFVFRTGYTWKYADEKKFPWWGDDRIHFYSRETKKELWNIKSPENTPLIFPDGSAVINYWDSGGFDIYNLEGKKVFKHRQEIWGGASFAISPDSTYFAVVPDSKQPLMLFKKDGTKLWEKGRHSKIASISDGASYISTYPYLLSPSYAPDQLSTHLGLVYDKNGNKILEGLGILSGDGKKIAMYSSDKMTVLSLPDKQILKEIPMQIKLPKDTGPFFAVFSHDGHYLVVKNNNSIIIFDLIENQRKEIAFMELKTFPQIRLTTDGKFLVVHPGAGSSGNPIYYYQLY